MINNTHHLPTAPETPRPSGPHTKHTPPERGEGVKSTLSTFAVLLVAPLIAIFLTIFVFQSYQVDGESMETTLRHNDRLVVWKLPKTWSHITGHAYIPKRGDIVVFTEPSLGQFGQSPGKQLIKRVVGLPGDRVVIGNGVLTVYNQKILKGFNRMRHYRTETPFKTRPLMDPGRSVRIKYL
ncbi:MAG TPA: signal peptidase I [Candidatus Saccharimonadales bacterium]